MNKNKYVDSQNNLKNYLKEKYTAKNNIFFHLHLFSCFDAQMFSFTWLSMNNAGVED